MCLMHSCFSSVGYVIAGKPGMVEIPALLPAMTDFCLVLFMPIT